MTTSVRECSDQPFDDGVAFAIAYLVNTSDKISLAAEIFQNADLAGMDFSQLMDSEKYAMRKVADYLCIEITGI
jgi:hypothetical protein